MRAAITRGSIMVTDPELMLDYRVADIDYTEWEDGSFEYRFTPDYEVMGMVPGELFQGIPGLNLDLCMPEYVRRNRVPVFISERTPSENREDVRELLDEVGLDYLDRLEWLIRTDTRYSGDPLYVVRRLDREPLEVGSMEEMAPRSALAMRELLDAICAGRDVIGDGFGIREGNRRAFHALLRGLYAKERAFLEQRRLEGVKKGAEQGHYRGRARKSIDEVKLAYTVERLDAGELTAQEAADSLGVSRATFYRRLKELREGGAVA